MKVGKRDFNPEPGLKKAHTWRLGNGGELDTEGTAGLCILDTVITNQRRRSSVFFHEALALIPGTFKESACCVGAYIIKESFALSDSVSEAPVDFDLLLLFL